MYSARQLEYEPFCIFGHDALFTDRRIYKDTIPRGMYAYDIRCDDEGEPGTLERKVGGQFYGTVILNKAIPLGEYGCKRIQNDDYGFYEEHLLTLSDFMKTHPPQFREPER